MLATTSRTSAPRATSPRPQPGPAGPSTAAGTPDFPTDAAHLREGGYRPLSEEVFGPAPVVVGTLPPELDGTFVRSGPNPMGPRRPGGHLFAGEPMLHGVRLREGRAEWYRNRWVRTDAVSRRLGELPTPGPRNGRYAAAGSTVVRHAGRTLVVGDAGVLPHEIGADLTTVARIDFDGTLPGGLSAHPKVDPLTGEMLAVVHSPDTPCVNLVTVGTDGRVRRSQQVPMPAISMMHAFSITENHAVLYDLPVTYDASRAATGSRVPYSWDDAHGARLCVVPREGGEARRFEIDPCFVFHPVNAYEESRDRIVVDVVRHQRVFDLDPLQPSESEPVLWRWTLDLRTGTVTEEQLADHTVEFPRIDDRFTGSRHRYTFAVEMERAGLAGSAVVRHDLETGRTDVHRFGHGREAGEATFVPRHADAPEGDGWLITLVHDTARKRSDLVVLDTADLTGEPVAVVHLPVAVPHGFHSTWLPA